MGTALFANPSLPEDCVKEIESYLRHSDFASVADLIGALEVPPGRGVIRAGRQAS